MKSNNLFNRPHNFFKRPNNIFNGTKFICLSAQIILPLIENAILNLQAHFQK